MAQMPGLCLRGQSAKAPAGRGAVCSGRGLSWALPAACRARRLEGSLGIQPVTVCGMFLSWEGVPLGDSFRPFARTAPVWRF